ncbi:hypothetical protein CLUG_00237 [Clavispora lusitaniae ATCC 42720]|uniref:Uncharacterized protein n=1 Tax=Clavispora lusitaniae (strain ATCC 42720) TaxID=306902 RepID=C4XWB4_CLAL4|nr:uncharacterized protein CLUG_00237 [Clavispora lusitaniae ATCC 42720]EEQ36114.1 hypothetical protein CLUG_00237 [Clavispora lusitaniae ATCC 42720]
MNSSTTTREKRPAKNNAAAASAFNAEPSSADNTTTFLVVKGITSVKRAWSNGKGTRTVTTPTGAVWAARFTTALSCAASCAPCTTNTVSGDAWPTYSNGCKFVPASLLYVAKAQSTAASMSAGAPLPTARSCWYKRPSAGTDMTPWKRAKVRANSGPSNT